MKKYAFILILLNFSLVYKGYAQSTVNASGYTKDSKYFIRVSDYNRIDILDLIDKSSYSIASADKYAIYDLIVADNNIFYTCGREGIIRKWNIKGELLQSFGQTIYSLNTIAIDKNNNTIIGGSGDGHLYVWNLETGVYMKALKVHSGGISSSSLSGNTLYTSGFDGSIYKTILSTWSTELLFKGDNERPFYDLITIGQEFLILSRLDIDIDSPSDPTVCLTTYDLVKNKISDDECFVLLYDLSVFINSTNPACYNSTSLGLYRYGDTLDKFTFHDPGSVISLNKKGKIIYDQDKDRENDGAGFVHFSPDLKWFVSVESVGDAAYYPIMDHPDDEPTTWYINTRAHVDTLSTNESLDLVVPNISKEIEILRSNKLAETSDIIPVVQNSFLKTYQKIISTDSSKIAVSNESNVIKVFDINTKKLLNNLTYESAVVRLTAHPFAPLFASLHVDGKLNIWDFENLVLLKSYDYIDIEKFSKSHRERYPDYTIPDPLDGLRIAQSYGAIAYEIIAFSEMGDEIRVLNPWVEKSTQNFTSVNLFNNKSSIDDTFNPEDYADQPDIMFDVIGPFAFSLDYECYYDTGNTKNRLINKEVEPNTFIDSIYSDISRAMEYVVPGVHSSDYGLEMVLDYGKAIYSIDLRTLRNNSVELAKIPNRYSSYTEKIKFIADELTVPKSDKFDNFFSVTRSIDTLYAKVVEHENGTRIYGKSEIRANLNEFYYDQWGIGKVKQLSKREYYRWTPNLQFPVPITKQELVSAEEEIATDEESSGFGEYVCEDVGWYDYVGEDYVTEWEYLAQDTDKIRLVKNTTTGISAHSENCEYYTSILPTNGIVIVEAANKKEYGRIPPQSSRVIYQEFLRNSDYFITTNLNGEISFWDWKNQPIVKPVVTFIGSKDELFVMTPDFYYSALTPKANNIMFRKNGVLFGFEQFDLKYNRPDIILDRLGYADSTLVQAYHKAYQKRLKKMGFTEDMLQDDFHLPELKIENFEYMPTITDSASVGIKLGLSDAKYKLDRINVWVNDVAVYGSDGISLRDEDINEYDTEVRVDLIKGKNKIQVSVLNQAGAESYKETVEIVSNAGKDKPDLYLITIGESEFKDSDYNLTYAAKDANDIAALFTKSPVYNKVHTKTLVNEEVTKENLNGLKTFIQQAEINDEVMLFIAGHGVLDAELDYFFATYDMDFSRPQERGIAYQDLEGLLDGIKPLKKMLFIDACHSGEIDKEEVQLIARSTTKTEGIQFRAVDNAAAPKLGAQNTSELTKSLFTDLRKGTGATVISSAGGMEFAMEGDDWNNGLFTYAMINGIQTMEADLNKDGEIWLSELKNYVSTQVAELSNGKQQPTSRIENQVLDYRVW